MREEMGVFLTGDECWFGRERTTKLRKHPYSTFQTFDDDKDMAI